MPPLNFTVLASVNVFLIHTKTRLISALVHANSFVRLAVANR